MAPSDDDELRANVRESLSDLLRTLGYSNELRDYSAVFGNPIDEIYCQRFDDLYHPDHPNFLSMFCASERHALEDLNAALKWYAALVEGRALKDVLQTAWWQRVQSLARRALQVMAERPCLN